MAALSLSSFPQLTTARLQLRRLDLRDASEIYLLRSDEKVNKYLDRPKATSVQDAEAFINKINAAIDRRESLFWAIFLKGQARLCGTICLWNFSEEEKKAEIGYELLPEFHGRGIMQEALATLIAFAFDRLHLEKIEAWTVQPNIYSIRVLENNHFERDKQMESKIDPSRDGADCIIYSLSKEQYLNSSS